MKKQWKKLAAVFTMTAMLFQHTCSAVAMETEIQTQSVTEAVVQTQDIPEAVAQAAPQAVTEKQTEAQTQAVTEKQTEAQTQPVAEQQTEAQTQPVTEQQTEAQMQAVTEKQTEAQTQPVTEQQTEAQSQSETESESESETERQTERSERENSGAEVKTEDLQKQLRSVLPYLFVAGTLVFPEELEEVLTDVVWEDAALLEGLKGTALELANAKSAGKVIVLNLYVDGKGVLDTAQLDQLFADHRLDVTSHQYLINIIADSKGQTLSFSGYEMVCSGARTVYENRTQAGDVIYNFAALEDGNYVGYEGKLTLQGNLQGTFLAPQADVQIQSNLAGAVYAGRITVSETVDDLLHIIFAEGQEEESEETEIETETKTETETETEIATETEGLTEQESEAKMYPVRVSVTLEVKGHSGAEEKTNEKFYIQIYRDKAKTDAVLSQPLLFEMNEKTARTQSVELEQAARKQTYYIAETTKDGAALENAFAYKVTYPDLKNGAFTAETGKTAAVTVRNSLKDSVVKFGVTNGESYLPGAMLVLKDAAGNVITVDGTTEFTSAEELIVLCNELTDGASYYLSEVKAPEGFLPVPDMKFTVKRGGVTEVVLENQAASQNAYRLTVNTQVYSQDKQVYAYDTTSGTYEAEGAYTFYAALFTDEARTQKVSDVQKITVSELSGSTTFLHLTAGQTYYVAQTDEYGQVETASAARQIRYAEEGRVCMDSEAKTTLIQNIYSSLPAGYRYTGTLTITLKLQNEAGESIQGTETFYAGIFRHADYSDTPTIVPLDLRNISSASVKRRILLSGEEAMVYYVAQVDASGKRITEDSSFGYRITVDQPSVTISGGDDKAVTIIDQAKPSKVTLYLTKKVYEGNSQKKTNETFYVGLFQDPEFKKAYTKPVAMKMNGKSELTLKLSLNLGTAANATIYVAEVDENGAVIQDEKDFGYEIKLVNSTAAFTAERREVQTILINAVYGSASTEEWQQILGSDGNDTPEGGYSYVTGNGIASPYGDAVATGDETPVLLYVGLMAVAFVILLVGIFLVLFRRKR